MYYYTLDENNALIGGPFQITNPKAALPANAVVTEHTPPIPAEGEAVFAAGSGRWAVGPAIPPSPPVTPDLPIVTHYEFATLYLTATENDAWLDLLDEARAVAPVDRTQDQKDQLRAYNHFELAGAVDFNTDATQAAIYALFLWGVLTQERADALAAATPIV